MQKRGANVIDLWEILFRCLCFEHTDVEQLNTVVLPRNGSSSKVIQKCGFRLNGGAVIEGQMHFHYTLTKEEWRSINS